MTLYLVEKKDDEAYYRVIDVVIGTSNVMAFDQSLEPWQTVVTEGIWMAFRPMFREQGYKYRVMNYDEEQQYGVRCRCRGPKPW